MIRVRFSRAFALLIAGAAAACGKQTSLPPNWVTVPDRASHDSFFPIATGIHATASCNDCHGAFNTFKQFDCLTCHDQFPALTQASLATGHAGVAGYTYASASCYQCHPRGIGGAPANHTPNFFPIGTGTAHADVGCTQCHGDLAAATDPTTLACASCHTSLASFGGKHDSVKDFGTSPTSPDCLKCHGDSQVDRVADHQAMFPVVFGSATHDTVCLHCHTGMRTDKPFATDFGPGGYDCLTCHEQTTPLTQASLASGHTGISGYAYASASCYQCHPDGTGAPANHTPNFFPIGAGTAHATVACTQCHTNLATPNDPAAFACYTCHSTLASPNLPPWPGHTASVTVNTLNGPVTISVAIPTVHTSRSATTTLDMTDPANCLRCHANSQVDLVSSHPTGDRALGSNDSHDGAGCATCHSTFRTDKTFGADFTVQVPQPCFTSAPPGCVTCHPGPPPCGN